MRSARGRGITDVLLHEFVADNCEVASNIFADDTTDTVRGTPIATARQFVWPRKWPEHLLGSRSEVKVFRVDGILLRTESDADGVEFGVAWIGEETISDVLPCGLGSRNLVVKSLRNSGSSIDLKGTQLSS